MLLHCQSGSAAALEASLTRPMTAQRRRRAVSRKVGFLVACCVAVAGLTQSCAFTAGMPKANGSFQFVAGRVAEPVRWQPSPRLNLRTPTAAAAETASASEEEPEGWMPTPAERKKLIPLAIMFFCILFNYTILRDTKDVLVVTAPKSGAEIIPFLKTYVQLPGAVVFTVIYSKMSNKMSQEKIFRTVVTVFLAFFALFGFVIYPNVGWLHPHALADKLALLVPARFSALIAIIRNWSYALFYMMAELWGSITISVLFWGLANRIMSVKEAKRYYPLFGLGANVALIFSGQYVRFVSRLREKLPAGVDAWGVSLKLLTAAVLAAGITIIFAHRRVVNKILNDPECVDQTSLKKAKTKTKMGLAESAKYLASSSYIRNLAMMVIGYGMSINIVEVTWKSRLKAQYADPNSYSMFMGMFSSITGTVTLGSMLASRFIFQKFGWGFAAKITPLMILTTGTIFFSQVLFPKVWAPAAIALGTTPLMLAVLVGAAQNILSKSSKYALFDPCKEMAYIPLDAEQKSKGKAAIDVIGNPLGKSGGSFIQQACIFAFGSLAASAPCLGAVLIVVVTAWLAAARSLDKEMMEKEAEEAATVDADAEA
mmetsp:Transcript_37788/g.68871  ORF Transcript_37788/g.68871 Transcript_37788/m.68871 type:complete len:598 (+) Transcript_37788:47-1840(+)